jgi:hypothetical protein
VLDSAKTGFGNTRVAVVLVIVKDTLPRIKNQRLIKLIMRNITQHTMKRSLRNKKRDITEKKQKKKHMHMKKRAVAEVNQVTLKR